MGNTANGTTPAFDSDKTVDVVNASGKAPFLLVCEHASSFIPEEFANLGLSADVQQSHIGWDPGAYEVARFMSQLLDAPLVAQRVSRLVYDCNRPPSAESAIPARSEIYDVPGNQNLSESDRQRRVEMVYEPFCGAVAAQVDHLTGRTKTPMFITIHSFTPTYFGKQRAVELGILHDADARLATVLLGALGAHSKLRLGENEPYGPEDGVTHTLVKHALPRNLHNVMVEIRNDLIASTEDQKKIATLLCDAILDAHFLFEKQVG